MVKISLNQALRKGIEAHKLKKYLVATKYYQAVLRSDPLNPDANHNFGVLLMQHRKIDDALTLFEKAIQVKPEEPQYRLSFIDALITNDNIKQAYQHIEQTKSLYINELHVKKMTEQLSRIQVMKNIAEREGQKVVAEHPSKDRMKELEVIYHSGKFDLMHFEAEKLKSEYPNSWKISNIIGLTFYAQGDYSVSLMHFENAIKLDHGAWPVYSNLGLAQQALGLFDKAEKSFTVAINLKPDSGSNYNNLANLHLAKGKLKPAIELYEMALKLDPKNPDYIFHLGSALMANGDFSTAAQKLEIVLSLQPQNTRARYLHDSLVGTKRDNVPSDYVETLFDKYANIFETSLVKKLGYDGPTILRDIVLSSASPKKRYRILDLGCGTGLIGLVFSDLYNEITGVDLSQAMLEQARQKNIYTNLVHSEVNHFLNTRKLSYDIIIAADVFVYMGDLAKTFELISQNKKVAGLFAFTTENLEDGEYILKKTGRFAHSSCYIESLAKKFGFNILVYKVKNLRKERGSYLEGGYYLLSF